MKGRTILTCFISIFLFLQTGEAGWWSDTLPLKAERAKKVLETFDEVIAKALHDFKVPGLAIAIVTEGHVVYSKAFGVRDKEKGLPVTTDTLFAIGSCTKAFTTFALGCLIEEGLLDWDMPVIDVLDEFRLWDEVAMQQVTLRDLAAHRSGMARHNFMWYNSKLSRDDILHRLRYLEPACGLRERFYYNDLMYLALGLAMERCTHKSWEQIVTEKILTPLGMHRTNFSIEQNMANAAWPYIEKNGLIKRMPLRDFSMVGPAASMNSTVSDLSMWMQMQLHDGKGLLNSPSILKEMHAPQVIVSGYPESKEALIHAYGLGWCIQSYRGSYNVSHDGGVDGFTSVVSLFPREKIGIAILANKNLSILPRLLAMHAADLLLELPQLDWLREGLEGMQKHQQEEKKEEIGKKQDTHPSHPLKDYIGVYEHPGYGRLDVDLKDEKLIIHFNEIEYQLDHWHYDIFSIAEESQDLILSRKGTKVTFHHDTNGEIETLLIPFEWNAKDILFQRKKMHPHETLTYLRQFVGTYQLYHYEVEILLRNGALIANIPGQPSYDLEPVSENAFSIKSQAGSSVRFILEGGKVKEALLALPYGIVYTAKRVFKNLP